MGNQIHITLLCCLCCLASIHFDSGLSIGWEKRASPAMWDREDPEYPCMDFSSICQDQCNNLLFRSLYCKKTCRLCNPKDVCLITHSVKTEVYVKGMEFQMKCALCQCHGSNKISCVYLTCNKFKLPSKECVWKPPKNPDRCCPVPDCPHSNIIIYPKNWVEM